MKKYCLLFLSLQIFLGQCLLEATEKSKPFVICNKTYGTVEQYSIGEKSEKEKFSYNKRIEVPLGFIQGSVEFYRCNAETNQVWRVTDLEISTRSAAAKQPAKDDYDTRISLKEEEILSEEDPAIVQRLQEELAELQTLRANLGE